MKSTFPPHPTYKVDINIGRLPPDPRGNRITAVVFENRFPNTNLFHHLQPAGVTSRQKKKTNYLFVKWGYSALNHLSNVTMESGIHTWTTVVHGFKWGTFKSRTPPPSPTHSHAICQIKRFAGVWKCSFFSSQSANTAFRYTSAQLGTAEWSRGPRANV